MRACPFCAEDIREAAIRCKHCHSDVPAAAPAERKPRRGLSPLGRSVAVGVGVLTLAVAAVPAAGPIMAGLRDSRCQPETWKEWHVAMRRQCLQPAYVCEHMTTGALLHDPDLARYLDGRRASAEADGSEGDAIADLVGHMRQTFGCDPERSAAGPPQPGGPDMPTFEAAQDAPRSL